MCLCLPCLCSALTVFSSLKQQIEEISILQKEYESIEVYVLRFWIFQGASISDIVGLVCAYESGVPIKLAS